MALAIARSLTLCGGYAQSAALHNYLEWFKNDPVDVGSTVGYVLGKAQYGYPAEWAAREFHELSGGKSAGNGALMRQTPIIIYYRHDLEALEEAIRADTALTHHDPLAAECGVYYARQLARLLVDPQAEFEEPEHPMIKEALSIDRREILQRVHTQMGFCMTALSVAAYATRYAPDYETGMTWVVNMGGDSDTNGAIAGAMLGAKFGPEGIPARWRERLECHDELGSLVDWSLSGEAGYANDLWFGLPPQQRPGYVEPGFDKPLHEWDDADIEAAVGLPQGFMADCDDETREAILEILAD
jgi:ADP-ribosyl-[dinitrogen reductase] hydrolase